MKYLDRRDKQYKDRDLWLDTNTLVPVTKAAVELCLAQSKGRQQEGMLDYRHLFQSRQYTDDEIMDLVKCHSGVYSVFILYYVEDDEGHALTSEQASSIRTGSPTAEYLPLITPEIIKARKNKRRLPNDLSATSLTPDQFNVLGYFSRDLRLLQCSAFMKDGPGTLKTKSDTLWIETAVTAEEIRSFVMVFRRLYMKNVENDLANFGEAVRVFSEIPNTPSGWVSMFADEYRVCLGTSPLCNCPASTGAVPFSRKRLIDVFIYTQFAHQPNKCRAAQYQKCLSAVDGNMAKLVWLFLSSMWQVSIHMANAGVVIADFYDDYGQQHGKSADIIASVLDTHAGIGMLEKHADRRRRLFQEKTGELAVSMWQTHGCPAGGHEQYLNEAAIQLRAAMGVEGGDITEARREI